MKPFYQLQIDDSLEELDTNIEGLSRQDATQRLKEYGPNILTEKKKRTILSILLGQLNDFMIIILLVAAGISFFTGERIDAYVILAIIVGNAWLGFSQEYRAEESMKKLKKLAPQQASVIRDGKTDKIEVRQIVPGDILSLNAGDVVPADARLIEINALKVDESSLTGESNPVEKDPDPIDREDPVPGDQVNMVFKGTMISNGSGKAAVTATGMKTELGRIAELLETGDEKTPLQKRLTKFSKQLAIAIIAICLLVFAYGMVRGEDFSNMFLVTLSLAVAALPEALPAVVSIALARGAQWMATKKALIRKLPAVETLGSVTYICSDKTGTLTKNEMMVEQVEASENNTDLLHYAMLLNQELRPDENNGWTGDSTEKALLNYAINKGLHPDDAEKKYPLEARLPFDSDRMRMSTLHRDGDKWLLITKGAPSKIAEVVSEESKNSIKKWLELNREWASQGLRVLFYAFKYLDQRPSKLNVDEEKDLEFLGVAGMIDPPRPEVLEAIKDCKSAGIKVVMITGDQALTAKAIAEKLEIISDESSVVVTGSEIRKMDEEQFNDKVKQIAVYARVSPEQKLNIIAALQDQSEIVAMTGDGVNDAPSLKKADIGLAMGITGTEVTKEAADMILLDDQFETIVKAVKEGRRIYENIRKFIVYVLSCNFSEILTISFAPVLGFPIPLLPIHILWINLVTDGFPGIALVTEPTEKDIMKMPPRNPKEKLFAGGLLPRILITGVIMAAAALLIQWWSISRGMGAREQQTMVFTTLCFIQLGNAVSVRSSRSMYLYNMFSNIRLIWAIVLVVVLQASMIYLPFLQNIFKVSYLSWQSMLMIVVVTIGCTNAIDLLKILLKKRVETEKGEEK